VTPACHQAAAVQPVSHVQRRVTRQVTLIQAGRIERRRLIEQHAEVPVAEAKLGAIIDALKQSDRPPRTQRRERHASSEHAPKKRSKSGVGKCLSSSKPKCLPTLRPRAISVFALFFVPAYPASRSTRHARHRSTLADTPAP